MKKTLLLTCALGLGLFATAQTAQNIPNSKPLLLTDGYVNIIDAVAPEEGESAPNVTTHEKYNNGQTNYLNNFKPGDIAELCVKSEQESCYILHFEVACKNDTPGSSGKFTLTDKATNDVVWYQENTFDPVAKAWYGFSASEIYISDPIPAGEYIFSIEFQNENGGKSNTFNIGEFTFEARESIETFSLYTYIEPSEDAGSIVLNPSQNVYLADTEVTATATAKSGWKFSHFENGYGDVINENPYKFVMTEPIDLTAYFDEVKMYNEIPGWIDFYTRLVSGGKIQTSTKQNNLDGEPYGELGQVDNLGDYRNGKTEDFELRVSEAGTYSFNVGYSCKKNDGDTPSVTFSIFDKAAYDEDPTAATAEWTYTLVPDEGIENNWQQYYSRIVEGVNLTAGSKILHLLFQEPKSNKYTVNILRLGFGNTPNWWENGSDGIEDVIAGDNAPVKAYNLQGIEVAPDAKGLIILSNGTKVYNK